MHETLRQRDPVTARFTLGPRWRHRNSLLVADLQPAMWIGRQPLEHGLQKLFQGLSRAGAAHRPLQSDGWRYLLEFLAVFVLVIIDSVYQFVNEGVEGLVGCAQRWRDEDMVGGILSALPRPALPPGIAAQSAGCEPHGDLDHRYAIGVGGEYILCQFAGCKQQLAFAGLVKHFGRGQGVSGGWWAGVRDQGMAPVGGGSADPNRHVSHQMSYLKKIPGKRSPADRRVQEGGRSG